jgi:hypothetical protein
VHVTHDGGAWIGVPVPPGSAPEGNDGKTAYDVFGPDGRWRGRALAEQRVRPLEIGETYLLGLREDELGVQYLELYGLGPPSGDVSSDSGAARPSR